ncbi:hypothetical protein KEM55_005767 [Ascosphaera atra]|nr:hypothetical protein KEM55_005767 [Ascosphaera atra]
MAEEKPRILIVGGLTWTGRHLAYLIHKNNLASDVRLVDKQLPQLAYLSPEMAEACPMEKFVQADPAREQSIPRIFNRSDGKEFDYVINVFGEWRVSQADEIYRLRSHLPAVTIGKEAARRGVKAFVDISLGSIYASSKKPMKEGASEKPVYKQAKWKQQTERELQAIEGLNLVILRIPMLYGAYDASFVSTSICMARAYQALEKPLTLLNHADQPMYTLWVVDLARAALHAANWRARLGTRKPTDPVVFNVVDHNKTTKETVAETLRREFNMKVTFVGTLLTQFAKLNSESVVEEMNDDTLTIWAELLQKKGIDRPGPITPFLEKEMLKETDLALDGSLFEEVTGFKYERETVPENWIREIIESYEHMGWWP